VLESHALLRASQSGKPALFDEDVGAPAKREQAQDRNEGES
jgi:hypothetical protein